MRLIDADAWVEALNSVVNDPNEIMPARTMAVGLIAMISERPTVCDLDKICEEIDTMSGIQFDGNHESYELNWCIETTRAKEIVKKRGMNDDEKGEKQ